jgi:hypothetical protein
MDLLDAQAVVDRFIREVEAETDGAKRHDLEMISLALSRYVGFDFRDDPLTWRLWYRWAVNRDTTVIEPLLVSGDSIKIQLGTRIAMIEGDEDCVLKVLKATAKLPEPAQRVVAWSLIEWSKTDKDTRAVSSWTGRSETLLDPDTWRSMAREINRLMATHWLYRTQKGGHPTLLTQTQKGGHPTLLTQSR